MARELGFDIEEARRLFEKTPSWHVVAKALSTEEHSVHPYSVQKALEPLGCKSARKRGNVCLWDQEEAARLRATGMSVKKIAEKLKKPERTIYQGLARMNKKKVPDRFRKK